MEFNLDDLGGRRFVSKRNNTGKKVWQEGVMRIEITETHIYLSKDLWSKLELVEKDVVTMDVKNGNIYLLKIDSELIHPEARLPSSKEKTQGAYIGARACRNKKALQLLSKDPVFTQGIYDCLFLEAKFPCVKLTPVVEEELTEEVSVEAPVEVVVDTVVEEEQPLVDATPEESNW